MSQTSSGRLDPLTSLRFFAALMVVVHHSQGLFGVPELHVNLGQGVSFFFVLSGFILTHVYAGLDSVAAARSFWRARIARIWPAHVASLAIGTWLVGYDWHWTTAAAALLLVQAWIPDASYYFAYNGVAWSISAELFFYLAFPLLVHRWERTWWIKLLAVSALLLGILLVSRSAGMPEYRDPVAAPGIPVITRHGLVYISPLSRIFEFVVGMCLALAHRRVAGRPLSPTVATALELITVALCVYAIGHSDAWAAIAKASWLGEPVFMWVTHCGSFLAFGALILVFAQSRGWLSAVLSAPWLVVLGEISFSIYLLHQILLNHYRARLAHELHISAIEGQLLFLLVLLPAAYLMWSWVEMPMRRLMVGGRRIHGSAAMDRTREHNHGINTKSIAAALVLLSACGWIAHLTGRGESVSDADAARMTPPAFRPYVGITFDRRFELRGLRLACDGSGAHLDIAWLSHEAAPGLAWVNSVHMTDAAGTILSQADYPAPRTHAGDRWLDRVDIPAERLTPATTQIALGIYEQAHGALVADHGPVDWGGRRVLVPLSACVRADRAAGH